MAEEKEKHQRYLGLEKIQFIVGSGSKKRVIYRQKKGRIFREK
jgi:hypothetical protein